MLDACIGYLWQLNERSLGNKHVRER